MRAVVVGGGIAGLTAAFRLTEAGFAVQVLEAQSRLGGLIHSANVGGVPMDLGAEAFAVARPAALELIEELGLGNQVVSPSTSDAKILATGKLLKIPHGVLGIPANLNSAEVIEAIGEEAAAAARDLDSQPWQMPVGPTLAQLVANRLGQVVLDTFVTPVVAGVHASSPSLLEAEVVAPGLVAKAAQLGSLTAAVSAIRASAAKPGAAVATLTGGMTALIDALAGHLKSHGVSICTSTEVTAIARDGLGYRVSSGFAEGTEAAGTGRAFQGTSVYADVVVLAATPEVSARLLADFDGVGSNLTKIKVVDVTVVAIKATSAAANASPLGSGVLVAPGNAAVMAKASTHTSAKWSHAKELVGQTGQLIRLSYGRDGEAPKASDWLTKTAKQDVGRLYGLNESDIGEVVIQEWPKSLVQAKPGHQETLAALREALKQHPGLGVVGAGLGGNGITGIIAKVNEEIARIVHS